MAKLDSYVSAMVICCWSFIQAADRPGRNVCTAVWSEAKPWMDQATFKKIPKQVLGVTPKHSSVVKRKITKQTPPMHPWLQAPHAQEARVPDHTHASSSTHRPIYAAFPASPQAPMLAQSLPASPRSRIHMLSIVLGHTPLICFPP